jgi:hypothetical protein
MISGRASTARKGTTEATLIISKTLMTMIMPSSR